MPRTKHDILWQRLSAYLSNEMDVCIKYIQRHDTISSDLLLTLHSRMHALAKVALEMERMEAEYTENE